jgi:Mn2+/Fe2+ NRAMP family transporter
MPRLKAVPTPVATSVVEPRAAPSGGQPVSRQVGRQKVSFRLRLSHFLMVAGPGLIVMVADNKAGAISTYTESGARFGTSLLWVLILLLPVTYFVREMVARLGIAAGEGLAAIIYERFSVWWGRFCLLDLLVLNFLTLVTEFAAVALASKELGYAPSVAVPMAAVGLILLVGTGSYRRWERMTLLLCGLNVVWIWLAVAVRPDWGVAVLDSVVPSMPPGHAPGDASWRPERRAGVSRGRHSRHHDRAVAVVFPAILRRR